MSNRGLDVMKRAASQVKSKGGEAYKHRLQLKPEDGAVPLRYRGVLTGFTTVYDEEELRTFNKDQLAWHLIELAGAYSSEMNVKQLMEAIQSRYDYKEPFYFASHYAERNMGVKGVSPYLNCGDYAATLDRNLTTSCRVCHVINEGDKSLGYASSKFAFSFYDYRSQHVLKGRTKDDKNEYEVCTMEVKGYCAHCSHNNKVGDKSEDARPRYTMGLRYAELSMSAAQALVSAEHRVMRRCRTCLTGTLSPVGAYCPLKDCYHPLDFDELLCNGWDPDTNKAVDCPHCGQGITPTLLYQCNTCDTPISCKLYDVDVLASVTKDGPGKKAKNNWQFAERIPVRPLDPSNELDAKILALPMFDFEKMLEQSTVEQQMHWIGTREDPMGEVEPQRYTSSGPPASRMAPATPKALPTIVPPAPKRQVVAAPTPTVAKRGGIARPASVVQAPWEAEPVKKRFVLPKR